MQSVSLPIDVMSIGMRLYIGCGGGWMNTTQVQHKYIKIEVRLHHQMRTCSVLSGLSIGRHGCLG